MQVIQIPVQGDGEVQQFSFQVSNQPPVDCLQQIRTRLVMAICLS